MLSRNSLPNWIAKPGLDENKSRVTLSMNDDVRAQQSVTPPAPVFDDATRLGELAARRKHVADTIGAKAMLVLFSTEPRVYTNDVDYQFRQENNLYYLTNLNQKRRDAGV